MLSQNSPKFKVGDLVYYKNILHNYIVIAKILKLDSVAYHYEIIYPASSYEQMSGNFKFFENANKYETETQILTEEMKMELL